MPNILITGAGSGIGRVTARLFLEHGWHVGLIGRREEALAETAAAVRQQTRRADERAAEELAVRLVMPLGLCLLPAFVCWGVVPVVMALLGAGPG